MSLVNNDDVPPKKTLLVFKHNPKAGGGSIKMLLHEIKNYKYQAHFLKESEYCADDPEGIEKLEKMSTCVGGICFDDSKCEKSFMDLIGSNDTLVYIREKFRAYPIFQQYAFVISSIREPCDQYLSLWAYGSTGKGSFHYLDGFGKDAPYFDSPRDIEAFRHDWLRHPEFEGIIAKRHDQSFGTHHHHYRNNENVLDGYAVDCWVYVDDFQATMYSCLREYEMQGGHVNWKAPLLNDLVQDLQMKNQLIRRLGSDGDNTTHKHHFSKNDPLHNNQEHHHSNCTRYFDEETATFIRYGNEEFIYDEFGYTSCCGDRVPRNTLIAPPPLADEQSHEKKNETHSFHGPDQVEVEEGSDFIRMNGFNEFFSPQYVRNSSLTRNGIEEMVDFKEMKHFLQISTLMFLFPAIVYLRRRAIQ